MNGLISILKKFEDNRANRNYSQWNFEAVADCFAPCAEEILLGGYFLVNDNIIIDIGALELYYHEEEGEIKDYIMYHTNEHPSRSKIFVLEGGVPYFEFGSFNFHQSGIDVTFENSDKKYRASFLIRSYRVLKKGDDLKDCQDIFDACSTHLFDDMFYKGISLGFGSSITWINYNKGGSIISCPRRNVAEYYFNEQHKIVKAIAKISEEEYQKNKSRYIKINGKYFKQDMRRWQFKRENIIEK